MINMKKVNTNFLLSLPLLLASLTACGSKETPAIDLEKLQNSQGAYVYLETDWGASPTEVSELTGLELGSPMGMRDGDRSFQVYTIEDQRFLGKSWTVQYQFDEDGLYAFSINTQQATDQASKLHDQIIQKLTNCYGEPDLTEESPLTYEDRTLAREARRWYAPLEKGETVLNLNLVDALKETGQQSLSFGVMYRQEGSFSRDLTQSGS